MKAKKSLGQNFLKSEMVLKKIIEAGEINSDDVILEIGPGKGALTKKLLEKVSEGSPRSQIIAVEKDNELFELLKIKFKEEIEIGKLILKNEDILEFDLQKTVSENSTARKFFHGLAGVGDPGIRGPEKKFAPWSFKIIANIPYNITGAILKKFLTEKNQPSLMVLMVQHEVAQRIVARDKKESILSISVKAYGEPKLIMKVGARYFSPAPKVDSAIISIKNISRKNFTSPQIFEEKFWEIVKTGFAHKRKRLFSNLKNIIPLENSTLVSLKDKRAENLTLSEWIQLAK